MTKKILALALAGTTAFSVFAGAMSVSAAAYAWEGDTSNSYDDAFTHVASVPAIPLTNGKIAFADLKKISFEDVTDSFFDYGPASATPATAKKYYVVDWKVKDATKTAAFKEAVEKAIEDAGDTGTAYTGTNESAVATALAAAYNLVGTSGSETGVVLKDATSKDDDLIAAYGKLVTNYGAIKDYFEGGSVKETLVGADYELVDFDYYDAEKLFADIKTSYDKAQYADPLSYYTYLNSEYTRIIGAVEKADNSSLIDTYDHFLEATTTLTETDYSATNWAGIEHNIRLADIKAKDGKYADAISLLRTALDTTPLKGDASALRDTLMSMYADNKGNTKASYIVKAYVNGSYQTTAANAIYDEADYKSGNTYSDEWYALFRDPIWYYNPLDAVAADDASSDLTYNGIYGYAYELYTSTKSKKVAQSRLDVANEMLIAALEDLDPSTSSSEWAMLKLEKTVELAESLVETDFNTSSTKWKTFTKNLERAQSALNGSTAGRNTVEAVTEALNDSMIALTSVAKNPSYNLKKEFKDVLKDAKAALKALTDQNAVQYKALDTAIKNAEVLGTYLDVNGKLGFADLISNYEASIAEMQAAITGFNQTQGWYTNEAGQYMYGEGDSYYVDGWKKIGNFWFFFNEDGTAKQNEWFENGGSWYYCGNSCVAYSGWGKVDGSWYYFGKDCTMKTGWVRPANSYYYLDPTSGKMVTGWATIGGKSYYFSTDSATLGAMLVSTTTPDGYEVGADGAWIQK